jgi:hypothetical protein
MNKIAKYVLFAFGLAVLLMAVKGPKVFNPLFNWGREEAKPVEGL